MQPLPVSPSRCKIGALVRDPCTDILAILQHQMARAWKPRRVSGDIRRKCAPARITSSYSTLWQSALHEDGSLRLSSIAPTWVLRSCLCKSTSMRMWARMVHLQGSWATDPWKCSPLCVLIMGYPSWAALPSSTIGSRQ